MRNLREGLGWEAANIPTGLSRFDARL
jgi:hypothetical protein